MANRYLISNGNSTNAAIFDGGTFPATTDVLYLNGKTLTIVADFEVAEIRNDANVGLGVVLGGYVWHNTTTTTVTADLYSYNNSQVYLINTNVDVVLVGNVHQHGGSHGIWVTASTGTLKIYGNMNTNSATQYGCVSNWASVAFVVEIFGNVYANAGSTASLRVLATGIIKLHGIVYVTTTGGIVLYSPTGSTGYILVEGIVMQQSCTASMIGDVRFDDNPIMVVVDKLGVALPLTDPNTADYPLEADVRDGVKYNTNTLEGTLVVPNKNTVATGVVFDNGTVGDAILTQQAVAQAVAQVVGDQFNHFG